MFGKYDELVDSTHQSSVPTEHSLAGDDFMSAPPPSSQPAPNAQEQGQAPMPVTTGGTDGPAFSSDVSPTYEAPIEQPAAAQQDTVFPEYDAPKPAPTQMAAPQPEQEAYAPAPLPEEVAVPDSMSFSAQFANGTSPAAPQMSAATTEPAGHDSQEVAAPTPEQDYSQSAPTADAQEASAPEAAAEAPAAEPAPEAQAPEGLTPEALMQMLQGSQQQMPQNQIDALQQASQALDDETLRSANGKTRIQAVALKSLVDKAQSQDATALEQLSSHGFEILEKLADGLPISDPRLDAVVESAAALIDADLVVPADAKSQQASAMQGVAQGAFMQGQVAMTRFQQEQAQAQQQAAAEEERARPKSSEEISHEARIANQRDAAAGMNPHRYL